MCIELCAGCARPSATLKESGFKTIAVDHSKNRHKPLHGITLLDLSDDQCLQHLLQLLDCPDLVFYLHATPPHGTFARVQKTSLRRVTHRSAPNRQPLRSKQHPQGLPNLTGPSLERVTRANNIVRNIAAILHHFFMHSSCVISLANPRRSRVWNTTWIKTLIDQCSLFPVHFQADSRAPWITWYTNNSGMSCLATTNSAQESAAEATGLSPPTTHVDYTAPVCEQVADLLKKEAISNNAVFANAPKTCNKRHKLQTSGQRAAEAGRQPRGNLLPQIIPEFAEIRDIPWTDTDVPVPKILTAELQQLYGLPPNSKLLPTEKGKREAKGAAEAQVNRILKVGIYRTPEEFFDQACKLEHPFDNNSSINDDCKRAMFWLLTEGFQAVSAARNDLFTYYEQLKAELEPAEQMIHNAMDPCREKLVRKKKFLLFQAMCKDAGVDDDGLLDILVNGVKLTGLASETGQFPPDVAEPALDDAQLMKTTRWTRRAILGKTAATADDEAAAQVWQDAQEEVSRGWLTGPYTEEDLKRVLGPLFVVSKRFGLKQADKVRAIDDLSESLVNSAFGASYKLDLPGVDGISVMARTFLECVSSDGKVYLKLSDGSSLRGVLHPSLSSCDAKNLRGRTLDLDAAYKQLLVAKQSLWCSVLAIENVNNQRELYLSHVIPFGASASVYSFNRCARAIHSIGERLFGLVWSNFYDDYPQIDLTVCGDHAQETAERLLALIGWDFSTKPHKRQKMYSVFDALGVTFDLSSSSQGKIVVRNKTSRIQQINDDIDSILFRNSLSTARAAALRGKLQFAETHTFGRVISSHLRHVQMRACGKLTGSCVTPELKVDLEWAKQFLQSNLPRTLQIGMSKRKLVVFSDASLEGQDREAGIGVVAVLVVDGMVTEKFFISERVPEPVLKSWQNRTPKVIATLELFAAVAGVSKLAETFSAIRTFIFVDNEAARAGLISMYSILTTHNDLLKSFGEVCRKRCLYTWVARVPSLSNPSDAPSRLIIDDLLSNGFTRLQVSWPKAK